MRIRLQAILDNFCVEHAEEISKIPPVEFQAYRSDLEEVIETICYIPPGEFRAWLDELSRFADAFGVWELS